MAYAPPGCGGQVLAAWWRAWARWCADTGLGRRQDRDEPRTGTLLLGQAGPGPAGERLVAGGGPADRYQDNHGQGCQPIIGPGPPPGSGCSGPGQPVVNLPGDIAFE